MPSTFKLPFPATDISALEECYCRDQKEMDKETAAFCAGKRIARGERTIGQLQIIFDWKSPRPKPHLESNSAVRIKECLDKACEAGLSGNAIGAINHLDKIKGVGVRMASAILTCIDQDRYTVLDFRALTALKYPMQAAASDYTAEAYGIYLGACDRIATENNITKRSLDRALWQWSKNKSKSKRPDKCEN